MGTYLDHVKTQARKIYRKEEPHGPSYTIRLEIFQHVFNYSLAIPRARWRTKTGARADHQTCASLRSLSLTNCLTGPQAALLFIKNSHLHLTFRQRTQVRSAERIEFL